MARPPRQSDAAAASWPARVARGAQRWPWLALLVLLVAVHGRAGAERAPAPTHARELAGLGDVTPAHCGRMVPAVDAPHAARARPPHTGGRPAPRVAPHPRGEGRLLAVWHGDAEVSGEQTHAARDRLARGYDATGPPRSSGDSPALFVAGGRGAPARAPQPVG